MNKKEKSIISMYQRDIRSKLPNENEIEYKFILEHFQKANTFIFSEYFSFHNQLKDYKDFIIESNFALKWLTKLSKEKEATNTFIIGGSIIRQINNRFFNSTPILYNGKLLGFYDKQELFGKEIGILTKGSDILEEVHPQTKKKWGILICADVYIKNVFDDYSEVDYIAIPTSSPFRKDDTVEEQEKRDKQIFIQGARRSNSILFKCCSVGQVGQDSESSKAPRLQGRSLIVNSDEVLLNTPHVHWAGTLNYNEENQEIFLRSFTDILRK